jgi:hypothetical protein
MEVICPQQLDIAGNNSVDTAATESHPLESSPV